MSNDLHEKENLPKTMMLKKMGIFEMYKEIELWVGMKWKQEKKNGENPWMKIKNSNWIFVSISDIVYAKME